MIINKKLIVIAATVSLGVVGGLTQSDKLLNSLGGTAHAIGIDSKDITYVPSISTNTNISVDSESEPASFAWGKTGTTNVSIINGTVEGDVTDAAHNWILGSTNQPNVPTPIYSIKPGDKYRISNAGKTQSGQSLDIIATIKSVSKDTHSNEETGPREYTSGIAFQDSKKLGPTPDKYGSIGVMIFGWEKTDIDYEYVKSGTNTPVEVTTATYWADIDLWQGVNEDSSNKKVIMSNSAETKKYLDVDGKYIYSLDGQKDFDGLNDADSSAYIGVGESSKVNIKYEGVYRGGKNSSISPNNTWYGYRYDIFGQYSNIVINPPNKVTNPKKTVSDSDEKNVVANNTGLTIRDFEYDISVQTSKGKFKKLEMTDTFPKEFTTSTDKIKVFAGTKDVTDKFDISLSGQNLKVTLKSSEYNSEDLQNVQLRVNAKGKGPEWLGSSFKNTANWKDGFTSQDTNEVQTTIPSKPVVNKTVSTQGDFKPAEKPEDAEKVTNRPDDYIWKLDFTLSNYTDFSKIELKDNLEGLQTVMPETVKVYDWTGKDVTSQGTVSSTPSGDKNIVTWAANADMLKTVNAKYGKNSKETPKFSMRLTTNVKNATNDQESKFFNKDMGVVVIPNVGTVTEGDNTGDVSIDSNTSHVQFPKPGESSIKKMVAVDGTDPMKDEGWSDKLSLKTHDTLYSYKTLFKLSKNFNYNEEGFTLTDKFENIQNYNKVQILAEDGSDISDQFNIEDKKDGTITSIIAKAKNNKDWSDSGKSLIMYISGVNLTGSNADQLLNYLEPQDFDESDPWKDGITIPNISNLTETSKVPGFSKDTDSNHTWTNFIVDPSIDKSIEVDQDAVIDPGDATDELSVKDAVGDAQATIESLTGKENKNDVAALRKALLTSTDAKEIKTLSDKLK